MWTKAVRGTALLKVELVLVLAELDPVVVVEAKAFAGGVSTPEDGV
jgi:hypothetical protein